jgi:hypothetical protein
MTLLQALDTLRGHCQQRVIPIEQAKEELVVLVQIRAEVRDRVRHRTHMTREEENLVTRSNWKRCRCSI